MTTSTTAVVAPVQPLFTAAERTALAGFLAGCSGLTRDAYALDLRQYAACAPCPGSTATPWRKSCSNTPPRSTSDARAWTPSAMRKVVRRTLAYGRPVTVAATSSSSRSSRRSAVSGVSPSSMWAPGRC